MAKHRTHSEPLPKPAEKLFTLFRRAAMLPNVTEIRITKETFSVTRHMADSDDSAVLPPTPDLPDVEFVLESLGDALVEAVFDPERNPYLVLVDETEKLSKEKLVASAIVAPQGTLLADYYGLEHAPETLLGIPVIYHEMGDRYPDKILLCAGPTPFLSDASKGVIIDTGV